MGPRGITINIIHLSPTDSDTHLGAGRVADLVRPNIPINRYGLAKGIASASAVSYRTGRKPALSAALEQS